MLRRVRNALAEKQAVDAAGLIQSAVFKLLPSACAASITSSREPNS